MIGSKLHIVVIAIFLLAANNGARAQWVQYEGIQHVQSGVKLEIRQGRAYMVTSLADLLLPGELTLTTEPSQHFTLVYESEIRHNTALNNIWLQNDRKTVRLYDDEGQPRFDVILDRPAATELFVPLVVLEQKHSSVSPKDLLSELYVYQPGQEVSASLPAQFELRKDTLGVFVSNIDVRYPLVVDPVILCSFIGGERDDILQDVEMDDEFLYVCGVSESRTYPVSPDAWQKGGGIDSTDAVVSVVSRLSGKVLYSTYIIGNSADEALAIDVDTQGRIWIAGSTSSSDFHVSDNAVDTTLDGQDGFVMCLSSNGREVLYSTLLGGSGADVVESIDIDRFGNVVVSGTTWSSDFPTTSPSSAELQVSSAFVARMNNTLSEILYSRTIGGRSTERCLAQAVAHSSIVLVGSTDSDDFPMAGTPKQDAKLGSYDGWILGLDIQADTLLFSTYVGTTVTKSGGTAFSVVKDIVPRFSSFGVVVETTGVDFPVSDDAIAVELADGPNTLFIEYGADGAEVFSSYIGPAQGQSSTWNQVEAIETYVDGFIIAGLTFSSGYPTTDVELNDYNGNGDAFVSILRPPYDSLWYSTFIGGSERDIALGVASFSMDVAVVGRTTSDGATFPLVRPFLNSNGGVEDGFIAEINPLFKIVQPSDNVSVCAGDTLFVEWQSTQSIDSVQVSLQRLVGGFKVESEAVASSLEVLPLWVPEVCPPGLYTLHIRSNSDPSLERVSHVMVRVDKKPRFLEHPIDVVACKDSVVFLESKAAGTPNSSYRWQVRTEGIWTDIVGAISQDLPVATASFLPGESRLFRSVASNICGSDTSDVAEVSVDNTMVTILIAGVHRVCPQEKINVTAVPSQQIEAMYEWRYRIDEQPWIVLSETSASLTFSLPDVGVNQRIEITCTAFGNCVYPASNTVVFKEFVPPVWVSHPGRAAVCVGDDVLFEAQYSSLFGISVSETTWQVFSNGEWRDTVVADELQLRRVPQSLNGTLYRAIIRSCAGNDTTEIAELLVATQHSLVPSAPIVDIPALPTCVYSTTSVLRVENIGSEPEVINSYDIGLSYDFRVTSQLPMTIEPGSTAELSIRFEPVRDGVTTAILQLYPSCGDPIVIDVRGELTESPPSLLPSFVAMEEIELCLNSATSTTVLINTTDKSLTITNVATPAGVDVSVANTTIAPDGMSSIDITYSPQIAGLFDGEIVFEYKLDDNEECVGTLTYTYSALALPVQFETDVEYVELLPSLACSDEQSTTTLTLTNTSPFSIPFTVEVSGEYEYIASSANTNMLEPGESVRLHVSLLGDLSPGTYDGLVTVALGKCLAQYEIRLATTVESLGIMATPFSQIVFDNNGTPQSVSIDLQRQSSTSRTITDIVVDGGSSAYSISGISIGDIINDMSTEITVSFDGTFDAGSAEVKVYVEDCPEPFVLYIEMDSDALFGEVAVQNAIADIGETTALTLDVDANLYEQSLQVELAYNKSIMFPLNSIRTSSGAGTLERSVFAVNAMEQTWPEFTALLGNARSDTVSVISVHIDVDGAILPVEGSHSGGLFTVVNAHPDQTIAIPEIGLTVSPSPLSVNQTLSIEFDSRLADGELEIFDLFGARLYASSLAAIALPIELAQPDLSGWRTGLFFVRITKGQFVAVRSFLVVQ